MAVSGVDRVVVATDDVRIADHAREFGAEVAMTSSEARNGTERCAEAWEAARGEGSGGPRAPPLPGRAHDDPELRGARLPIGLSRCLHPVALPPRRL